MGFFKYPYTDLNELNLDWVIAKIKYIEQASHIIYNNETSGLVATNVQDALDEIVTIIATQGVVTWNGRAGVVVPEAHDYTGAQVDYDGTNSGLVATDVQSAIDEVDNNLDTLAASLPGTFVESFNTRTGAVTPDSGDYNASQITYDNTVSGLTATDTQAAIDELAAAPGGVTSWNARTGAVTPQTSDYDADQVDYDNTTSGMTATDVQDAIDELDNRLDNFSVAASQVSYDNTQSGLTATDAQAALDEIANDVLSSGVASFNGRTGAVNPAIGDYDLTMLGDVNAGSPSDGDALVYDANSSKWVPGASGAASLSGLSDVTITTPSDGQSLVYDSNSSKWINGAGGASALSALTDVTITSAASDDILKFNGAGWVNAPAGYVIKEYVTFTDSNDTNTVAVRLQALAQAALAYISALPANEVCESFAIEGFGVFGPTSRVLWDNTATRYNPYFFSTGVAGTTMTIRTVLCTSESAGVYYQSTVSGNTISLLDRSSLVASGNITLTLAHHVKI